MPSTICIASPTTSTRRLLLQLNLSHSSVYQIIRDDLRLRPYRLQMLQALSDEDKADRLSFSDISRAIQNNPSFLESIIFSDEAHFYLTGEVNRHNSVYWSSENPHHHDTTTLHPPKV